MCARSQGLSGSQGVMMPASNVEDLMLREDILDAVAAGKFHVWPVAKIEEGIEILTGMTAGIAERRWLISGRHGVRAGE